MKYLFGEEEKKAIEFIYQAVEIAKNSSCARSKCGSIIVQDDKIIGSGFNSPPKDLEEQRKCLCSKKDYHKKVTDKTCCVHAEQRAIVDALKNKGSKIVGSRLFFIRLDDKGLPSRAGKPYCTICSKMALDVGIKEFILWHKDGICVYDTREYNLLSFKYQEPLA